MKKTKNKLLLCLASSLFLVGCGGNSTESSSTPVDEASTSQTSTDTTDSNSFEDSGTSSNSSEEEQVVTIEEVTGLLPGKTIQLVAKLNGVESNATWAMVDDGDTESTLTAEGLLKAGVTVGEVSVKATIGKAEGSLTIAIEEPTIDVDKLGVPTSYKVTYYSETETEPTPLASLEFVKDKGIYLDMSADASEYGEEFKGGIIAESDTLYNFLVTGNEAKFNYNTDAREETLTALNNSFDLAGSINSTNYDFLYLDEYYNEYMYEPKLDYDASVEFGIMQELSMIENGYESFCIGVDATTLALTCLYGVMEYEGEYYFFEMGLDEITDLSVTPVGENVSDGGEGEGGVEEPFLDSSVGE
ncbi:MAG TPA: hypothetical protein DEF61_01710 [Firmicutes bacterium]|nr:hypothetical protein [Bacillota bacterium]